MSKKLCFLATILLILFGCNNKDDDSSSNETHKYKTDEGKTIKIPNNPKRVVVLTTNQEISKTWYRYSRCGCRFS